MFVGHYGIALAAKAYQPERSLGGLFVATQALDIAFCGYLLAGIEEIRLVPGGTGPAGVELVLVPFSHGLAGALGISVLAGLLVAGWQRRRGDGSRWRSAAGLVAAVVLSHYVLDVLVHEALPVLGHDLEIGLGPSLAVALVLESLILLAGAGLYLRRTQARTAVGRYGMPAFVLALLAFNGYVATSPTPTSVVLLAVTNLAAYALLAVVAQWLDRGRTARET